MKRSTILLAVALLSVATPQAGVAQIGTQESESLVRRKLSGPRFGFTVFTGDVADLRASVNKEAMMTQFGWQFETQIATPSNGSQALLEWVFLVGGVEQDELNLSLSWLAGYRMPSGFEIGAGPAISTNKDSRDLNTSMILAAGATAPLGEMQLPLHVAVALAKGGPRITTLVGWIIG